MSIPPKWNISKAVNILNSNSARAMRMKFPFRQTFYNKEVWFYSDSHFVSSVEAKEAVIKKNYIKHQGEEDSGKA